MERSASCDVATLVSSPFSTGPEVGLGNACQHINMLDATGQDSVVAEARLCQPGSARIAHEDLADGISSMKLREFSQGSGGEVSQQAAPLGPSFPRRSVLDEAPARQQHRHDAQQLQNSGQQQTFPPYGVKAICGRRPRMEDAYKAVPFLLDVPVPADQLTQVDILPPRLATQVKSRANSPTASADGDASDGEFDHSSRTQPGEGNSTSSAPYMETLHFFGVFDGHGGAEAAMHCAQTLHQRIREALSAATSTNSPEPASQEGHVRPSDLAGMESVSNDIGVGAAVGTEEASLVQLQPATDLGSLSGLSSARRNSMSQSSCVDNESHSSDGIHVPALGVPAAEKVEGLPCSAETFESALTDAFNRTDEEFAKADNAALVGTTAVVALVGTRQLYVANCGDSRAVLCRGGTGIALTDDHKAAREDETARVEAAGGQILFWNGVRVMGVLAVSRAIGDHCLRPFVIARPEVTILARRPDDELLLLASDGLWDVLSNQEACTLAKRCLRRARQRGASRESAARIAATVLTRAAVDRGSRDNVTVVVVDLSPGGPEGECLASAASAMEDVMDAV
eukprot:jgi/Botrbrau1/20676/Bobra.0058s0008.3